MPNKDTQTPVETQPQTQLTQKSLLHGLCHLALFGIDCLPDDCSVLAPPVLPELGLDVHLVTSELTEGVRRAVEEHHLVIGDHFQVGEQGVPDKPLQVSLALLCCFVVLVTLNPSIRCTCQLGSPAAGCVSGVQAVAICSPPVSCGR